jgi:hypothetical protein
MKKNLLIAFAVLVTVNVNAQFSLTDKGFISSDDESKDYIVIDVPNTPQDKLFQKTKMYLNTLYNNPNFVTTAIDNEQIVIDAIDGEEMKIVFVMNGPNIWQFSYKYTFRFKDNRLQFTPLFKSLENTENNGSINLIGANVLGTVSGIFNKNGKCLKDKAKERIEEIVNGYVSDLTKNLNRDEKNDDW